jgi:hypothetical protein
MRHVSRYANSKFLGLRDSAWYSPFGGEGLAIPGAESRRMLGLECAPRVVSWPKGVGWGK